MASECSLADVLEPMLIRTQGGDASVATCFPPPTTLLVVSESH